MATRRLARWGFVLGLVAQTGCCHWCERWCTKPQPAAPVCQPCYPTTVGYPAPVPVAVPNTVPVYQAQQQNWANPTTPQVLTRNPATGCYCPQ